MTTSKRPRSDVRSREALINTRSFLLLSVKETVERDAVLREVDEALGVPAQLHSEAADEVNTRELVWTDSHKGKFACLNGRAYHSVSNFSIGWDAFFEGVHLGHTYTKEKAQQLIEKELK